MTEKAVTCGSCKLFAPNQVNRSGAGDCLDHHWKGTRSTRWPEDTRTPLPFPNEQRYCKRWEAK